MTQSSSSQQAPEAAKGGMSFGAISSLVGLGALGVFAFQNREDVTVKFIAWDFTWPIWALTIAAALLGALIWFGLGVMRRHRRRKERRDDRRD